MTDRWVSPETIAERCELSRRAIYRAIDRGELTATKVCSRLRVHEDDFGTWISSNRVRPQARTPVPAPRSLPASQGLRTLIRANEEREETGR